MAKGDDRRQVINEFDELQHKKKSDYTDVDVPHLKRVTPT